MNLIVLIIFLSVAVPTENTLTTYVVDWNITFLVPEEQMKDESKALALFFNQSHGTFNYCRNVEDYGCEKSKEVKIIIANGTQQLFTKYLTLGFIYSRKV